MASLQSVLNKPEPKMSDKNEAKQQPHPTFQANPDTQVVDFNWKGN